MTIAKRHPFLVLFNLLYVLVFGSYFAFFAKNYEFLLYVGVLVFFLTLIAATFEKTQFPGFILWLLSFWGLVHMAGGGIEVAGSALYGLELFHIVGAGDAFILKFDQVVHFYGFFTVTFVIFHLLARVIPVERGLKTVLFVSALSSIGLGAINEIVEFIAVVLIPETGVGGYFNTAIDLVFNALGALLASIVLYIRQQSGKTF